jgi:hypothetical protein
MTTIANNITDKKVRGFFKDIAEKHSNLINGHHIDILVSAIIKNIKDWEVKYFFEKVVKSDLLKKASNETMIKIKQNQTLKDIILSFIKMNKTT